MNWIHKIGYYELTKKKERADDWVIILDQSIQLGQDKVLVVYGIREKNIDFTRPLRFQDLTPLREVSRDKWTGEIIKDVILELQDEIGRIKYAVGDYASDIHKSMKLCKIPHVHDLTHKIALLLEKYYKTNPQYLDVIKKMSEMRVKYSQTKSAHIIPPKQRKKSRYQNIKIISDWCEKSLRYIEKNQNVDPEIYDKLKWLLDYKRFIDDLSSLNRVINDIEKELKHNGLSKKTKKKCCEAINELNSEAGHFFRKGLLKYFKQTKELLPRSDKVLISSDIIESAFGKYKNYLSLNPMAGVTNLILCISAFTASLTEESVQEALENTTIYDVKEWTQKFDICYK